MSKHKSHQYAEAEIVALSPREHVRQRPGMYVGGTDERALHHLIYEVVDNSIDEAFAGRCDHIWITLRNNHEVCIRDNGPGIPVEEDSKTGKISLEVIMTEVGAMLRLNKENYPISANLHGLGLAVVNALAENLVIEVARDGYLWKQTYRAGKPQKGVIQVRELNPGEVGTTITFKPDFTVLQPNPFSYDRLDSRARELAYLVKGMTISLWDERTNPPLHNEYCYEHSLADYVQYLSRYSDPLSPPISGSKRVVVSNSESPAYTFAVDFALQFTNGLPNTTLSYINTVETRNGGTHARALIAGIVAAINDQAYQESYRVHLENDELPLAFDQIKSGLACVVSILHPSPSFISPTKVQLGNPEVYDGIFEFVRTMLNEYFDENPVIAEAVVWQCIANRYPDD